MDLEKGLRIESDSTFGSKSVYREMCSHKLINP